MRRTAALVLGLALALAAGDSEATWRRFLRNQEATAAPAPVALYSTSGVTANGAMANPLTSGMAAWCATVRATPAGSDWAVSVGNANGLFSFVAAGSSLPTAPGIYLYRESSKGGAALTLRVYNNAGTETRRDTTSSTVNGSFRNQYHRVSLCYAPEGYTVRMDGRLGIAAFTAGTLTMPASLSRGSLGNNQFPYTLGTLGNYCISGPKAVVGTTAAESVAAACGEFTDTYSATLPCIGCVTPAPGATKVVALGDSITSGLGLPRPFPEKINALLGTSWNFVNAGEGGYRFSSMHARYQSTYKGQGYSYAILLGGVNNIANHGQTAAQAFAEWQLMADEMRTDGLTLVVVKLTPWKGYPTWTTGRQTTTDDLNTLLQGYCDTYGFTCIDSMAALEDPGTADTLLPANSGDWLHLSQVGSDVLATAVRAAFP